MCAQSAQAVTVRMHGIGVADATITAPFAAAELDMPGHFPRGELKQLECKYERLVALAESGAPISQIPRSVA